MRRLPAEHRARPSANSARRSMRFARLRDYADAMWTFPCPLSSAFARVPLVGEFFDPPEMITSVVQLISVGSNGNINSRLPTE